MPTNLVHRKKLPPLFITKGLTDDELENLFTDREETIETLSNSINLFVEKGERRHILIVGDRGVGKSTVMMKIKKDINDKWHDEIIPLFYMDWDFSHYGDIGDVLLEAAIGLSKEINVSMEDSSKLFSIESKISTAESIFNKIPYDKKIVLAIENFDTYLKMDKRNKHEREKLRTFVENHENILLIGTSVQYPKKQLGNYNHPFFGFFETLIPLEPFEEDHFIQQVEKLAKYYGKSELLNKEGGLKKNYAKKVKAIHNLTSGFPRLGVCLFEIFITDDPIEIYETFNNILDTLTPYFEGIRDRMSDNEKLAYRLIANSTTPCIVKGTFSISTLVETGNIEPNLMRSLLSKLNKKGFIEVVSRKKREKIYKVSNPLFSIWFIKTHIKDAAEAGKPILEFAYAFYSMEDIEDVSKVKTLIAYKEDTGQIIDAKQLKSYYVSGALKSSTESMEKGDFEKASVYLNEIDIDDISSKKRKVYAYIKRGIIQSLKGEHNKALEEIDRALDIDPKHAGAWNNKGTTLSNLGKLEDALTAFDKSEKLFQKDENVNPFLLLVVKINRTLVTIEIGNEINIKALIKSVLEYSVTADETTQTKVELIIKVYDSILSQMPHIAIESIGYLKELEKTLPENERIAASFEPISIAGKYLMEGDEVLEGLSDIMRKQVDMVLERVDKKAKIEKVESKPPKSKRKARK